MLGEKLKNGRNHKGYSQDEVAEKLQITRQAISKWENDKTVPDIDTLVKLSDLYEISLDQLMREEPETDKHPEAIREEKTQPEKAEANSNRNEQLESVFIFVVLVVSCMIPVLGSVVSVGILIHLKRKKTYPRSLNAIAILCLIINIFNLGMTLNDLVFHIGKATIL